MCEPLHSIIFMRKRKIFILTILFFSSLTNKAFCQEKVLNDILPILIDNSYNFDYPVFHDSLFWKYFNPNDSLELIYSESKNEFDYLKKRGIVLADSLFRLSEEEINLLKNKIVFNDGTSELLDSFISERKSNQFIDISKLTDIPYLISYEEFITKYGKRTQNGLIICSPVTLIHDNTVACFVYREFWQGHVNKYFVIAQKNLEKWRIRYLTSFDSSH